MSEDAPAPASTPAPTRKRRPRSLGRKLKLASLAVLLMLLLLEVGLRLAGFPKGFLQGTKRIWATDSERSLGLFRPDFQATITWPPELAYTIHTNHLGFRGPEPVEGRPTVLCLGDSTTFGSNVQDDATYPIQLQEELERRGLPVSTLNAGCPRTTITDQEPVLEEVLGQLHPKAVVLLFCGNDLVELDKAPARTRALEGRNIASDLASRLAISDAIIWITLELREAQLKASGPWPPPLRPDQGRTAGLEDQWKRYEQNLTKARDVAKAAGIPLLVAAFPGYEEVAHPEPCEIEQRLPPMLERLGLRYVDLYTPFRAAEAKQEKVFLVPLDAHANKAGNALVARTVADALQETWQEQ